MSELKTCPFCGCEATITRSYGQYRAHCLKRFKGCHVNMRTHDCNTSEEAVSDWNTRTTNQA